MKFSPTETFNGRNVFIIGATGFVGKVALSMLLDRFPGVGRVYVAPNMRRLGDSMTCLNSDRAQITSTRLIIVMPNALRWRFARCW